MKLVYYFLCQVTRMDRAMDTMIDVGKSKVIKDLFDSTTTDKLPRIVTTTAKGKAQLEIHYNGLVIRDSVSMSNPKLIQKEIWDISIQCQLNFYNQLVDTLKNYVMSCSWNGELHGAKLNEIVVFQRFSLLSKFRVIEDKYAVQLSLLGHNEVHHMLLVSTEDTLQTHWNL